MFSRTPPNRPPVRYVSVYIAIKSNRHLTADSNPSPDDCVGSDDGALSYAGAAHSELRGRIFVAKDLTAHSQKTVILNLDQPWEERIDQGTRGDTDPFP